MTKLVSPKVGIPKNGFLLLIFFFWAEILFWPTLFRETIKSPSMDNVHPYCWVSEFSLSETFGAAGWPDSIAAPTSLIYICISMGAFTRQYMGSYWGRQANLSSRFSTNCIHASACVLKGRGDLVRLWTFFAATVQYIYWQWTSLTISLSAKIFFFGLRYFFFGYAVLSSLT